MENHFSDVYKYFEFVKDEKTEKENNVSQWHSIYTCLVCKRLGKDKQIRCSKGVNSNLIRHLECLNHEVEYAEHLNYKSNKKRKLSAIPNSPSQSPYKFAFGNTSAFNGQFTGSPDNTPKKAKTLLDMGAVTKSSKYPKDGYTHQER